MRFGLHVPNYGPYGDPHVLRDLAVAAEGSGWDGFFMYDLIGPDEYEPPVADPWVTLAAVAQATQTLTLGPMVVPLPRRRPWKLALEAATLQNLSGGRLILGLGAGVAWDYTTYGESAKGSELASRLDEGADLVHKLLSGDSTNHAGDHYRTVDARFPRTDVPIWASGFWPRSAPVRASRGAAGLFPQMRDPADDFRLPTPSEIVAIRGDFVHAGGQPDGDLAIWSPNGEPAADRVQEYEDAGVTWWFSNAWKVPPADLHDRIAAGPLS